MAEKKSDKVKVLFVCVHNSARSQMAEEYLKKYGGEKFHVESAGLEPGAINPYVIRALAEEGIDITGKQTRSVFDLYKAGKIYTYIITVCSREAEENCPIFPGISERQNWPFPDPSGLSGSDEEIMTEVRKIRETIKERVKEFVDVIETKYIHPNTEE
ncbi:MAG: arsenate reductase ArsC [Spirochaetota bacterium]